MNTINISQKTKNKHLDFSHYEYIINSLIMLLILVSATSVKLNLLKILLWMLVLRFLISIQLSKMLRSLLEILISISILNYLPWLLFKKDPRIIRFLTILNLIKLLILFLLLKTKSNPTSFLLLMKPSII